MIKLISVIFILLFYILIISFLEWYRLDDKMERKKQEIQQLLNRLRAGNEDPRILVSSLHRLLLETGLTLEDFGTSKKEISNLLKRKNLENWMVDT